MKILIAGASGLVGSNCLRHFKEQGHEVVGTYFSYPTPDTVYFNTLDAKDANNFDVDLFSPDVIVHCGALTHVDYCEQHPEESFQKTVQSTINLVALSKRMNAKMVFISTDYVFDGKAGPYSEEDEVNPLSIYANHKLKAERFVRGNLPQSLILRITNVYGDELRNKNFVARIIEQCEEGKALTLTLPYDQYATPVNAWDVARAMLLLLQDRREGVFNIASTDWMNRVDLALNVLKYYPTAEYQLVPISTKDLNQPAARPLRGGLLKNKFSDLYPTFRFSTIDEYVAEKSKGTGRS